MENTRKSNQRRIIARLRTEVFVQHSVHDVQLPIQGLYRQRFFSPQPPDKGLAECTLSKGMEAY
jgi:hypothetical protein